MKSTVQDQLVDRPTSSPYEGCLGCGSWGVVRLVSGGCLDRRPDACPFFMRLTDKFRPTCRSSCHSVFSSFSELPAGISLKALLHRRNCGDSGGRAGFAGGLVGFSAKEDA